MRLINKAALGFVAAALVEPALNRAKTTLDAKLEETLRKHFGRGTYEYAIEANGDFYTKLLQWAGASDDVSLAAPNDGSYINKLRRIQETYNYDELGVRDFIITESANQGSLLTFWYKGVQADIVYSGEASDQRSDNRDSPSSSRNRTLSLQIRAENSALLDEIVQKVISYRPDVRPSSVKISSAWGDWISLPERDMRSLESVILPRQIKQDIVADVERFFNSRQSYQKLGLPWRRGYLFEGPPGGGKTSLLQALAGHFQVDLYMVTLNSFENDVKFHAAMSGVPPRSIVVFEDADAFNATNQRSDEPEKNNKSVTVSGLLNVIDGMMAPNGAIIVLTTNHPEKLDSALVRPGRIDYRLHFGPISQAELDDFVDLYYPGETHVTLERDDVMPASVVNIFKKQLPYEEAVVELKELVHGAI